MRLGWEAVGVRMGVARVATPVPTRSMLRCHGRVALLRGAVLASGPARTEALVGASPERA